MKYIRNLHNIDDRFSSVSPQIRKQHVLILQNLKKHVVDTTINRIEVFT